MMLTALLASGAAARGEARRIVALAPSVTETLFAVGAGADVVGVSDLSDYPAEAKRIDRVGSYMKPNVEVVVAHRPDLVIAVPSPGNREAVEALVALGLHVVVVEEGPTLADVLAAIRRIGDEAGRSEAGRSLASRIAAEVDAVRRRVARLPRRRTLMIVGENPLIAAGGENLLDELLTAAGAHNVAAALGRWPRLSVEFLVVERARGDHRFEHGRRERRQSVVLRRPRPRGGESQAPLCDPHRRSATTRAARRRRTWRSSRGSFTRKHSPPAAGQP